MAHIRLPQHSIPEPLLTAKADVLGAFILAIPEVQLVRPQWLRSWVPQGRAHVLPLPCLQTSSLQYPVDFGLAGLGVYPNIQATIILASFSFLYSRHQQIP